MENCKGEKEIEIDKSLDRKRYVQAELEKRVVDFIELCFDPKTQANARLKEILRKMMEEHRKE